jgi:polysaccharide biosynthesis/export protein
MKRAIVCLWSVALALTACSGGPLREDVIAQARSDERIAFDVVKIDDAVLATLAAQRSPAFPDRFKKYLPPPDLKIAVGDTISVVIWESASNGLFGNSLTELSLPEGAAARLLAGQSRASLEAPRPARDLAASPGSLDTLLAGAAAQGQAQGGQAPPGGAAPQTRTAAQGLSGLAEQTLTPSSSLSGANLDALSAGLLAGAASDLGPRATPGQAANTLFDTRFDLRQREGSEKLGASRLEELLKMAGQSGRAGTRIPDQPVASDGKISIPYAGRIEAAGRTPDEVQHIIEERLAQKALDPQAMVVVKRSAANSVSVAGEVIGGARVPLSPGGDRLLQVIAAAGGANAPVHDTVVRLSRDGVTASVPLATLVADPGQDIFAEPGDVLTLVKRPQTYAVFGATGKNAALTFTSDRLSLTEALAKAGGLLDQRADPRAVFLFRYEPVSLVQALGEPIATAAHDGLSPIVYRLDLMEANSYLLARRFPVHDKDVIFVADAELMPVYALFQVISQVTGPLQNSVVVCSYIKC